MSHLPHPRISKNVCLNLSFSIVNKKIRGKEREESAYYNHGALFSGIGFLIIFNSLVAQIST
jgi:hypothetical protein